MTLTELRLRLLESGYTPIPVTDPDAPYKAAGKRPLLPKWQEVEITADAIRSWGHGARRSDTNTGLRCGIVVGIDLDVRNPDLVQLLRNVAFDTVGATPLERVGQAPKSLLAYRADSPFRKHRSERLLMPDCQNAMVECLASGQQFVAFGIHPATRQPYEWSGRSPLDVPLADLPVITNAQASAFVAEAERLLRTAGGCEEGDVWASEQHPTHVSAPSASSWPPPTRQDVIDALDAVPNNVDWHWWVKIGAALHDALGDNGQELFVNWSAQSAKNDPKYTYLKWRSFRTCPMMTTASSLFWKARQNGWLSALEREDEGAHRRQTARRAFRMLRAGIPGIELLVRLHEENHRRPSPLSHEAVNNTALWCARQLAETRRAG
jgi:hypothetical protein